MTLDELEKNIKSLIDDYEYSCREDRDLKLLNTLHECEVLLGAYSLSVNTLATHNTLFNADRKCVHNHCYYLDAGQCKHQTTQECIDVHAEGFMHSSRLMINHANMSKKEED